MSWRRLTACVCKVGGTIKSWIEAFRERGHRFSTVRMADFIVVLDQGWVVEAGSHSDLVARGGLYAELYELQAKSYR